MSQNLLQQDPISIRFQVYVCTRQSCGLRFTAPYDPSVHYRCPACRAELELLGSPYSRMAVDPKISVRTGPQLEVLLDNIRSAWNVGSMLRTSDGAGVKRIHLCGVTSTPDNPKVAKTSLGAEKSLPWHFSPDGVAAVRSLQESGMRVWALEGGPRSVSLFDLHADLHGAPILLVAGNELTGVDPGILDMCERVVCLPMQGIKGSLNVAVAFGIAVYFIRFGAVEIEMRNG